MTVVGKILALLNLVFSLVVGGLAVLVFANSTNWKDYSDKVIAQAEAVKADRDQYARDLSKKAADLKTIEDNWDDAITALAGGKDKPEYQAYKAMSAVELLKEVANARDAARRDLAQAQKDLATLKLDERRQSALADPAVIASGARLTQVKDLQATNTTLRQEVQKAYAEANKERQDRIRAEVDRGTFAMRAADLERQVKDLAKELARAQLGKSATTAQRKRGEENPPQVDIEGRVVEVDANDELIKLSIGSDNGLEQGHTLKVFRLDPVPERSKYLGVLEVLSVRAHESVAKPLKRPLEHLQAGDRVASRIFVGN